MGTHTHSHTYAHWGMPPQREEGTHIFIHKLTFVTVTSFLVVMVSINYTESRSQPNYV